MAKSTKANSPEKTPAKPRKTAATKTPGNGKAPGNGKVTEIFISHERVAALAHQFFVERGYRHGYDAEDWFRAEQALRHKAS